MRVEIVLVDRTIQRRRDPDLVLGRWEIEILRQNADDGVRLAVHHQGLTQDVTFHPKFIPPKRVAENDHAILARFSFGLEERAPEKELEPEGWGKRRRDLLAEDPLRFAAAGDVKPVACHGREVFERLALSAPARELAGLKAYSFFGGQILPEHDEPVR